MAIDASIYNNVNNTPYNPLQTATTLQALSNAQQAGIGQQLQNKLTQAKFALGQYYSKNTHSGNVDYAGLQSDVASDPQTAMLLPQIQAEGRAALAPVSQFNPATQTNQLMSTQTQQAALNPQQNSLGAAVSPQVPPPPPITREQIDQGHENIDNIASSLKPLLNKSDLSVSDLIDNAGDLTAQYGKTNGKSGVSPQFLVQHLGTIPQGANGADPTPQQLQQWTQNTYDGLMQTKAAITSTHGPASTQPPAQAPATNVMPAVTDNTPQSAGGWSSPHVNVSNPTDYDTRLANSQGRIKQVADDATAAPSQLAPFNKVLNLAQQIQTGPGADSVNKMRTFLAAAGVGSDKMQNDSATFDELKKYMNGIQQSAGEGKTNQYLDLLNSSNPNDKLLPQTIENVARFGAAQLQGKIAKQQVMQQSLGNTVTPQAEEAFNSKWNGTYDPRAIELNMMRPAQQQEYLNKLSKTDKTKIINSFDMLHQAGAIQ